MKTLLPALFLAVTALGAVEPPRWLTISTLLGEREEELARDIRLLGKETIVDAVAYSCTLVPEGDPVVDKAALLAPRFRKMRALLKDSGVKEGILLQATMGHGWSPDSPAKGQKVLRGDGREMYKFCPLDETFLAYIRGQAKTIGALRPDFFMVDDDTRLITGINGCFCPLHLKEISRRAGRPFASREALQAELKKDATLAALWDDLMRDSIAGLVKVIRAEIPAEIPGEFCCCSLDAHHAGHLAKLLCAPGQRPVVRINNARYLADLRRDFPTTLLKTAFQIADLPEGTVVLDEADTCPQVRYSMGATELVHHMVMNALEGAGGAKIWITRLGNAHETASGAFYRETFRRQKGYMEQATALGLARDGVRVPLPAPQAHRAGCTLTGRGWFDWATALFGRYGIPWKTGRAQAGEVVALCGAQVPFFTDAELEAMLAGKVLLDGDAAMKLTARGFGKLIGVEAKAWRGPAISGERFADETLWGGPHAAADLTAHDPKAQVLGTFLHRVSGVSKETTDVGPGTILFANARGGKILTVGAHLPGYTALSGRFSYHNETRKRQIAKGLRLLAGAEMPGGVFYPGDAEILLETGTAKDGRKIVVVDNIGLDRLDTLDLVADRPPAVIRRLADDGSWQSVVFTREGAKLHLETAAETFRPVILAFETPAAVPPPPPYGVCAHITRSEIGEKLPKTLDAMAAAGIKYVRSDMDYPRVRRKDGTWNFAFYDRVFAEVDRRGMTFLPIYYAPVNPPKTDAELAAYRDYLVTCVSRYGRRMPVVEIWNEANISFFKGSDPAVYAKVLQTAYAAVKSVDPAIQVMYTGTAGVPHDWIRKTFQAGATNCFDIMNVHPYSHPGQPEGSMDRNTEKLRALMAEYGCGEKPIWYTEIGWPTHSLQLRHATVLQAGLKVARPEQKTWNVIWADNQLSGKVEESVLADDLRAVLPLGSTVAVCSQKETCARLAKGGVDAVVYPFDESFPAETTDAVNAFIAQGGVLIDFGGLPCYFPARGSVRGRDGEMLGRFPFGYRAWWTHKNGVYPESGRVYATAAGLAAGVKQEPTGFEAKRFLAPDRAGKEAEWIPLIAGKTTNGTELVAAAVIRYHGARKGAAVLCTLFGKGASGTNNEENQARYTTRGLAIAFAEGVQSYFTYNLRANEYDPFYSECHFGLMHADFTPKPAYAAYAAFTKKRPEGSVQTPGAWHDAKGAFFFPQWTRPDGQPAGLVWLIEGQEACSLAFTGHPTFFDHYGRRLGLREVKPGVHLVPLSTAPVYFVGGTLKRDELQQVK